MIPSMHDPRLLDHMGAEDGPSDAEAEEKEAKCHRSPSTTPRSTSGTLPHDYDMEMGMAPVEPQESVRLEEEIIQTSKMVMIRLHTARNHRTYLRIQSQNLLGLGNSMEDMVVLLCENVWRG